MAKHRQKSGSKESRGPAGPKSAVESAVAHPPVRRPKLLAVSIVLFALWFVFLLVTALRVGL